MAWNDDLTEAAYTSPSGKRKTFLYENVSKETALKTASFTFPELDGAEIQSLGRGGRTFPLTCIFSGADCAKEAAEFERLLEERGKGILEHPVYGKFTVVPTGSIKRTDNLVDGANEVSIEVTFAETLSEKDGPDSEISVADKLEEAIEEYIQAQAEEFAEIIQTETTDDEIQLQSVMKKNTATAFKDLQNMTETAGGALSSAKDAVKKAVKQLKDTKRFIDSAISKADQIAKNALEAATGVIRMVRTPCALASSVMSKIAGYSSIVTDILNNVRADPLGAKALANQAAGASVFLGAAVSSLCYGTAKSAQNGGSGGAQSSGNGGSQQAGNGGFRSRAEVLDAAEKITEQFEKYTEYINKESKTNAYVDTGASYEKLLNVVVYSLKTLEETAFDLPMEHTVVLDRDRQLFELLTELYGKDGFDRIDEFVSDNELTADEIILLPMGREVRYYA